MRLSYGGATTLARCTEEGPTGPPPGRQHRHCAESVTETLGASPHAPMTLSSPPLQERMFLLYKFTSNVCSCTGFYSCGTHGVGRACRFTELVL